MSHQKSWQKRCDVKYCVNANNYLVTFFPTPKDPNLFKQWQQAVQCTGTILPQNGRVCEKHFRPKDILEFTCLKKGEGSNTSLDVNNENIKLRVPVNGAIPSRFDDEIAIYCREKETNNKELPPNSMIIENKIVPCIESIKTEPKMIVAMSEKRPQLTFPIKKIVRPLNTAPTKLPVIFSQVEKKSNKELVDRVNLNSSLITSNSEENSLTQKQIIPPAEIAKAKLNNNERGNSIQMIRMRTIKDTFFEKIYNGLIEPRLPNRAWNIHNCEQPQKGVIFAELAELSSDHRVPPILKKSVFFDENFNVKIYFFGKLFPNVEYEPPKGISDVEEFLRQIDALKICEGGPRLTELSNSKFAFRDEAIYKWRHNNCELRLEKGQVCKNCSLLCKTVGERNIDLLTISKTSTKRIRIDPNEGNKINITKDH
ncbi:uncharacterized protein LOC122502049 [Leptopilina heterotoma]|uniref:uncharacterized protein LOC122502049 n=1 Tax=Leptopilina heterotoma TaxID=63436 RepID=UPI001CA91A69|nr:uncharacterized protein LOC122502049 [Leptopilina heterotoma]